MADNDDDDACMHAERGRVAIVNKRESYYDKRKCSSVIVSTTSHTTAVLKSTHFLLNEKQKTTNGIFARKQKEKKTENSNPDPI